ncbi:ATP-dependent RNA helicase DHX58-like isoform X1 [Mya arenaria]|uniref:ATP-dependent RNA helicase DHX58-like isoform X1 n=1 Tax=Mya arenaria TaxID=6604 RepID=UPI0022E79EFC|nr:ATP-dependent RNA helicase DHX58-like isoform X1 [Mya arenaria]
MSGGATRPVPLGEECQQNDHMSQQENTIGFYLECCFEYIVDHLDWKDLLPYEYFNRDDRMKIRGMSKKASNPRDVTQFSLETIIEMNHPDKFSKLLEVVEEAENPKILKILTAQAIPQNANKGDKIIGKYIKKIMDNLNVVDILPCLRAHGVISQRECEEALGQIQLGGRALAAFDLSLMIPNRHDSWLATFILALIESDHADNHRSIANAISHDLVLVADEYLKLKEPKPEWKDFLKYKGEVCLASLSSVFSFREEDGKRRQCPPSNHADGTGEAPEPRMHELHVSFDGKQRQCPPSDHANGSTEAPEPRMHDLQVSFDSGEPSQNNLSPAKFEAEEKSILTKQEDNSSVQSMDLSFSSLLIDTENTSESGSQETSGRARDHLDSSSGEEALDNALNDLKVPEKSHLNTQKSFSFDAIKDGKRTNVSAEKSMKDKDCCGEIDLSPYQKLTQPKYNEVGEKCAELHKVREKSRSPPEKNINETRELYRRSPEGLNITGDTPDDLSIETDLVEDKDIELRGYQNELAAPAIEGKNVVIVAPTGSGKTRVAFKIIQEHIRRQLGHGIPKVIFLVNQVALANQQGSECKKLLPKYKTHTITGDSQRSKNEFLKDFIDKRDILIVTAQVLLDSLVRKEIENICRFSLIIFDECHHTQSNHTFNQIMWLYLDMKFKKEVVNLPQIVGLTASVGVGKSRDTEKAVDHIKHLMANLDAEVICTVERNIGELREHVSLPDEEIKTVQKREKDFFGIAVDKLMSTLEQRMATSSLVKEMSEAEKFEGALKAPATKGNAAYTQWVSKLWQETAKLKDSRARKFLHPIRAHLECYNNALIIYNDARVDDALRYLDGEMTKWKENAIMDENEKLIYRAYKKLISCDFRVKCSENPKLDKLREMILKSYEGERGADSRGIIFVKTRELARAIVSWMKDTPGLRELGPIQFVGQNMSADKGGMTKVEQDEALKYFREGRHKIIVATSVAEEGLDITKCNLVIRYDHVTNEISKVQSRGRGRAADSKYVLIAEESTGMAEKEELNMIREVMMRKAIISLQDYIQRFPERFHSELKRFQEEANLDRKLKTLGTRRKLGMSGIGQFELKCLRCDSFICMSDNVKKVKEAHHVVVDETLPDRVDFVKGGATRFADDSIQFSGKVICKSCGGNLGVICIYRNLEFPVPKIENFLVVDRNGRQNTCKKWKGAPFVVEKLSNEDFKEILEARGATGDL